MYLPGAHSVCRPCYSWVVREKDAETSSGWMWDVVTLKHRAPLDRPPLALWHQPQNSPSSLVRGTNTLFRKKSFWTSQAVHWLRLQAFTAQILDLIPGQGTKILHAMRQGQKKTKAGKKKKKEDFWKHQNEQVLKNWGLGGLGWGLVE